MAVPVEVWAVRPDGAYRIRFRMPIPLALRCAKEDPAATALALVEFAHRRVDATLDEGDVDVLDPDT